MATTAAAILVLFYSAIFPANVLVLTSKIILVAGGTVGCVLGIRPRHSTTDCIAMTSGTPWIISVVAGIVAIRIMAEVGRRPAVCGVANVAL